MANTGTLPRTVAFVPPTPNGTEPPVSPSPIATADRSTIPPPILVSALRVRAGMDQFALPAREDKCGTPSLIHVSALVGSSGTV